MGAGESRQRSDLLAGLPLISKTKRECPVGTPSFVLSGGQRPGERGSRPRPACGRATSHPPLRPAGRHPAHPVRRRCRRPPGLPAAVREMWRLVAACGGSGQASRQPLRGATQSGRKAKPLRGRFAGLAPGQPRAGCGVGAPGRPGPHDVGAVGPSAPPARAAALRPALPARPRLRRRPCRAALPTHSPPGVAALPGSRWPTSGPRQAARQALAPLRAASSLPACAGRSARAAAAGRNLDRRAHWRRKRRLPAHSRAAGRGERRLRAGVPAVSPAGKAKASPAQGGKPPTSGGLACRCPGQRRQNVAGVPPSGGFPPLSHSGKTVVLLCLLLLVVCPLLAGSGGWSAGLAVCLAGRCLGLLGRSGPLLWRRLLPVSWRRNLRRAVSGLLVRRSVGWRLCGANKNPPPGDKSGEGFLASINDAGPKRQHARRQRRTAYESEAKHTGAAPVGGFLRR